MKQIDAYMNEALVGRRSPEITQADTDKIMMEDVRRALIDWLDLGHSIRTAASWGTMEDGVMVFDMSKVTSLDFIVIRDHLPKEIMNCPRPIRLRARRAFNEIIMAVDHMEGEESRKLSEIMSELRFNKLICGTNLQYFRDFTLHIEALLGSSIFRSLQAATKPKYLQAASTPGALQGTVIVDKIVRNSISTGILLPDNDISIELSAGARAMFRGASRLMTIISDELVDEMDSLWNSILKYSGGKPGTTSAGGADVPWALSKAAENIISKIHIPWEKDMKVLPTAIYFDSYDPIYFRYTLYIDGPGKYRIRKNE